MVLSYHCHRETFSLECFREEHFRWCRSHQRPIIANHERCGKDYQDCMHVKWGNFSILVPQRDDR